MWDVSKGLERRECSSEHSSLGITHFLQPCASSNKSKSTWVVLERTSTTVYLCTFQVSFKNSASINTSIPQWSLARAYTTKKSISLSREYSSKNIQKLFNNNNKTNFIIFS